MQEIKINTGKAVAVDLVVTKSSGTKLEVHDDSSRSGNDTDVDDTYIIPIYDEEPMAEEEVFAIDALKNDLRKLKGNNVDTKFAKTSVLGKPVLQSLRNQLVVRQPNAFKSKRPQMSKPRFASQVDVNNNLSRPVTQYYLPKRRESAFAKPDHMIASSSSRNSSKNMLGFSSNDMIHNHYLEEAKKKTHERNKNSKSSVMRTASPKPLLKKTSPTSDLRWKPTSRIFKTVGLRWVPTGKILASCTSKADSESTYENQVVSMSSTVTTANASDKRQQQPDSTSSTSTLATIVTVDGNFDM
ncbi:hypothetical protein Tco_0307784 [Tanacetum coccineum]